MTRAGTWLTAAFAAAVLAAGLLSACGGSDSTTTSAPSASEESSEGGAANSTGTGGSTSEGAGGEETGSATGSGEGSEPAPAENVATPLRVSGGGSDQFLSKGGDNSIQEFGEEADESELQEAAEAVHGFLVARAEGDWKGACSRMSASLVERLEQLAASSTELEDKSCASFLEAFTGRLAPREWREVTTVDAGSLRQEDDQAFLIYFGAEKNVYAMPLAEEDGEWKVTALSGNALS